MAFTNDDKSHEGNPNLTQLLLALFIVWYQRNQCSIPLWSFSLLLSWRKVMFFFFSAQI